ncbi:MAG: A24 family peptidase [Candidatus Aenigmatarchaeota archaeon]
MLELLRLAVALIGSAIGGYWDLKTTDVPDRLLFGMIGAGLVLNFLEWQLFGLQELFVSSVLVTATFGLFGIFMYKVGAWGGGDGAMLTAVGSLVPVWAVSSNLGWLPFSMVYFFTVFVIGIAWSVAYIFLAVARNRHLSRKFLAGLSASGRMFFVFAAAAAIILGTGTYPLSVMLATLLLIMTPLWVLSRVSEEAFNRKVPSGGLKPGDMLGEDLPGLKLWKRELRGLTAAEISRIRHAQRTVIIRTGVCYTPVFFFALLLLLLL